MRRNYLLLACIAGLATASSCLAAEAMDDRELGLSKTSVFEVPSPEPFAYSSVSPKKSEPIPRAFEGAPPQIPHRIDKYLPIRLGSANECLDCHDDPARWGDKPKKGKGTPMPQSHYTDLRKPGSKVGQDVRGARYLCTQCHGPQAEVDPLVANRFSPDSGK